MSIRSEEVLLNVVNHEIRREILHLLRIAERFYTQILENFVYGANCENRKISAILYNPDSFPLF